jgi:hypothetical protein
MNGDTAENLKGESTEPKAPISATEQAGNSEGSELSHNEFVAGMSGGSTFPEKEMPILPAKITEEALTSPEDNAALAKQRAILSGDGSDGNKMPDNVIPFPGTAGEKQPEEDLGIMRECQSWSISGSDQRFRNGRRT